VAGRPAIAVDFDITIALAQRMENTDTVTSVGLLSWAMARKQLKRAGEPMGVGMSSTHLLVRKVRTRHSLAVSTGKMDDGV
jgi:hypothetical protein